MSDSTPSERYADEATRLDEQLDRLLAQTRATYDKGLITASEAAAARVGILETHLAEIKALRIRCFGETTGDTL
jgi:outer membrane protein TolC